MCSVINKSLLKCAIICFQKVDFRTYRKKNESDNENIGSDYNYFFEMGCRWFREK